MNTFDQLSLSPAIQHSLGKLGFTKPTEIQATIIPTLTKNYQQDVHAQAQTGTGKTLAFGIPLLEAINIENKAVQGLVLAPTRELVLQIYESLQAVSAGSGIRIECIYGGMSITRQMSALKRGVHLVIGTPGRVNDLLRRKSLKLNNLNVLVLDEADIMLDMGFREELDQTLKYAPENRNIWLFSATVMSGIKKLITSHMNNVVSVKSSQSGLTNAKVEQYFCVMPMRKRLQAVLRFIQAEPNFNGIIFCRTKAQSSEVSENLVSKGIKANCLHGDMQQNLRNRVITGFKEKEFSILVATDVAARGIDVSDLSHVVNFSIPEDHESYIHRIGRTGRAGKTGKAILFVSPAEQYRLKRLEKATQSKLKEIDVPSVEHIVTAQKDTVAEFITGVQSKQHYNKAVDTSLTNMIAEYTPEQLRTVLKSLLHDKFFAGITELKKQSLKDAPALPQEICMNIGSEDGIDENRVRNYLHNTLNIARKDVGKVRVIKQKTFIAVPEQILKKVINKIRDNSITGKKVRVYLIEDDYNSRNGNSERRRPMRRRRNRRKSN